MMKAVTLLLALFVGLAFSQNATEEAELTRALQLIQTLPECARSCLLSAVASAGITGGNVDIASSCSNETATAGIEACSIEACTVREQLTAKNITETLCRRPPHEASHISVDSIIGVACSTVAFSMRMLSKIHFPCQTGARLDNDFGYDDAVITVVFILLIPITALSNVLTDLGIGRDVWTLPFENLTKLLRFYYIDEVLYLTALPLVKVSILLTYLRIFQSNNFRIWTYVAIGLNLAYWVTFFFATVFQCTPIDMAWHKWELKNISPGHCNNINAQGWASAAFNIALDILVVGLPMPMLWQMSLNIRKKILVMLMFGVGFFATIVAILRLQILVHFGDSQNLTYDYKQAGRWTIIELNTAICCACMPGIRNLIKRSFPRLMGGTTGHTSGAVTPGVSGLSGRTAIGSNADKHGSQVFMRPRHSDDSNFIPLDDVSTANTQPQIVLERWRAT